MVLPVGYACRKESGSTASLWGRFLVTVWAIPKESIQGTSYCCRHRSALRPITAWPISQGSESTGEIIHRAGSEQIEDVLGNLQRPGLLELNDRCLQSERASSSLGPGVRRKNLDSELKEELVSYSTVVS